MIKISVDEGAAFDALSILEVKSEIAQDKNQIWASWHMLRNEISGQIGLEAFNAVLSSKEYKDLVRKNRATFHLVDEIGESQEGLARRAYDANMERYNAKKNLQAAFFQQELREVKL
jgi:hypothetical protein